MLNQKCKMDIYLYLPQDVHLVKLKMGAGVFFTALKKTIETV